MRIQKRKIILPVMVLLLGMTALGAVLYGVGNIQRNHSRKNGEPECNDIF